MSEIALIKTKNGLTVYVGSKIYNIQSKDKRHDLILNYFGKNNQQKLRDVLEKETPKKTVEELIKSDSNFKYSKDKITYKGKPLHGVFIEKIKSMVRDNAPDLNPLKLFLENLYLNPSENSIQQLYSFLEVKELPLTTDGCFLAYRGLRSDYYSRQGNTKTKVLKGKVDEHGHIYNGVGEEIIIDRKDVDDNPNRDCSYGVHAGSFRYADNWRSGGKMVIVKIHPRDVVSVPSRDAEKMRVCRYEVVSEYFHEIEESVLDEKQEKNPEILKFKNKIKDFSTITEKVKTYLSNKKKQKIKSVTLRQIKNALKRFNDLTLLNLLDIVQGLPNKINVHKEHLSKTTIKIY